MPQSPIIGDIFSDVVDWVSDSPVGDVVNAAGDVIDFAAEITESEYFRATTIGLALLIPGAGPGAAAGLAAAYALIDQMEYAKDGYEKAKEIFNNTLDLLSSDDPTTRQEATHSADIVETESRERITAWRTIRRWYDEAVMPLSRGVTVAQSLINRLQSEAEAAAEIVQTPMLPAATLARQIAYNPSVGSEPRRLIDEQIHRLQMMVAAINRARGVNVMPTLSPDIRALDIQASAVKAIQAVLPKKTQAEAVEMWRDVVRPYQTSGMTWGEAVRSWAAALPGFDGASHASLRSAASAWARQKYGARTPPMLRPPAQTPDIAPPIVPEGTIRTLDVQAAAVNALKAHGLSTSEAQDMWHDAVAPYQNDSVTFGQAVALWLATLPGFDGTQSGVRTATRRWADDLAATPVASHFDAASFESGAMGTTGIYVAPSGIQHGNWAPNPNGQAGIVVSPAGIRHDRWAKAVQLG